MELDEMMKKQESKLRSGTPPTLKDQGEVKKPPKKTKTRNFQ